MKITAIKQQAKLTDRYSIYVDGKYAFSLGDTELLKSGLRMNQEINEQELADLKHRAALDKAYNRALNLIMRRPRSQQELQQYLKRKDYDEELARAIIKKLESNGFVDDADFARRWIENRRLLKATSKRRLLQELRQKGVEQEIIDVALQADETDEQQVLKGLIARKRQQSRYKDDLKLMQYLFRQGFDYGSIKTALEDVE